MKRDQHFATNQRASTGVIGSSVPWPECDIRCYNMGHSVHAINIAVLIIYMDNSHVGGHTDRGTLNPSTPDAFKTGYQFPHVLIDQALR